MFKIVLTNSSWGVEPEYRVDSVSIYLSILLVIEG